MIHSVSANKSSFRTVQFTEGLNVIIADKTDASTETDTRNGLGKSTLIDIIDFCLGGSSDKGKKLNIEALQEWVFTLDVTIQGNRVKISRAVAEANKIIIEGDTTSWPIIASEDEETREKYYNLAGWRRILGKQFFDLEDSYDETFSPSYRSLFSYFARTKSGAYISPFKYLPQQSAIVSRINIAFLLGLSWETSSKIQESENTIKRLGDLESSVEDGEFSLGELEATRVQLEEENGRMVDEIVTFKVHPQYEELQKNADSLTQTIHELTNQNVADQNRLSKYEKSIAEESAPEASQIEALYSECGLVFGDSVKRTLSDAREFHEKITANRKSFLDIEISKIREELVTRNREIEKLSNDRAELLQLLKTHGALQEMTKLQDRCNKKTYALEAVKSKIEDIKTLKTKLEGAKKDKEHFVKLAEQEHEERKEIWETAIRLFNGNAQALYSTGGRLIIDQTNNGYKFDVKIERSGSEGIEKMKIFCFDLELLELQLMKGNRIDFLIHDTLMYDSVDPRQRARALERADEISKKYGGQYICTMNSDMVPNTEFSEEFDFQSHVRLTLTDENPSSSLLGIRFSRGP